MNIYKLVIIYLHGVILQSVKDDEGQESKEQYTTGRYKQEDKTDAKTVNFRRLSGIELPCKLREGLRL